MSAERRRRFEIESDCWRTNVVILGDTDEMDDRHAAFGEEVGDDKVVAFNGHQLNWPRYYEQNYACNAPEEYSRVETAYIKAAMNFLAECGIDALTIRGLENSAGRRPDSFELSEGARISGDSLYEALRDLLREEFWCRLEGEHGSYIHVGWDYYLYVGVPCAPSASIEAAHADGLFVESFESPYKAH